MTDTVGIALIGLGIVLLFVLGMRMPAKRDSPLKIARPPPPPFEAAIDAKQPDWLETLDQFQRDGAARAEKDAKRRRWLRPIGFVARLLIYAAIFVVLYSYAPKDISDRPFASLTINDLSRTGMFIALAVVLVRALFTPSESDEVRNAWGWLGVWMIGGVILIAMIWGFHR